MLVTQKSHYAFRATFELAKQADEGGSRMKIADLAEAQGIPSRFLAVILGELKHAGIVDARRGSDGGYRLNRPAPQVYLGDILTAMQGAFKSVDCLADRDERNCPQHGDCVFAPTWEQLEKSLDAVLYGTTLQDLLDRETAARIQ